KAIKWSEGRDPQLPTGAKVGSDQPGADRIDLGTEIEIIRASLIESILFCALVIFSNLKPKFLAISNPSLPS
ncbi:MAG: hypothetical protein EBW08_05000, partial [Pelagibacteraceae bacterium]|nr:hypothetical protein [Pelagibacteraceae bacterium]